MTFLSVAGEFHRFSGHFILNGATVESLESKVEVQSIDTGDNVRDESLKGQAYLDTNQYPTMNFVSTQIETTPDAKIMMGKLEIKGVEKQISMPFKYHFTHKTKELSIKISTKISRADYKLDFGPMDILIGDTIKIEMELIGIKEK